jgi:hypothetical protein
VAQAIGGLAYVNGHADGPAPPLARLQAYHQASVFASIGVVAALIARDTSGRGQVVDVSLQAAVTGSLEHVPGYFHQDGPRATQPGHAPLDALLPRRPLSRRLGDALHARRLDVALRVGGERGLRRGPRRRRVGRTAYRQKARGALCSTRSIAGPPSTPVAELYEGAQLRRLPYAAVHAPEALLDDAHLAERGFFVPIEHPALGVTLPYPGAPFRMGDSPWHVARPPAIGEHGDAVAREWAGALAFGPLWSDRFQSNGQQGVARPVAGERRGEDDVPPRRFRASRTTRSCRAASDRPGARAGSQSRRARSRAARRPRPAQ